MSEQLTKHRQVFIMTIEIRLRHEYYMLHRNSSTVRTRDCRATGGDASAVVPFSLLADASFRTQRRDIILAIGAPQLPPEIAADSDFYINTLLVQGYCLYFTYLTKFVRFSCLSEIFPYGCIGDRSLIDRGRSYAFLENSLAKQGRAA